MLIRSSALINTGLTIYNHESNNVAKPPIKKAITHIHPSTLIYMVGIQLKEKGEARINSVPVHFFNIIASKRVLIFMIKISHLHVVKKHNIHHLS